MYLLDYISGVQVITQEPLPCVVFIIHSQKSFPLFSSAVCMTWGCFFLTWQKRYLFALSIVGIQQDLNFEFGFFFPLLWVFCL